MIRIILHAIGAVMAILLYAAAFPPRWEGHAYVAIVGVALFGWRVARTMTSFIEKADNPPTWQPPLKHGVWMSDEQSRK